MAKRLGKVRLLQAYKDCEIIEIACNQDDHDVSREKIVYSTLFAELINCADVYILMGGSVIEESLI